LHIAPTVASRGHDACGYGGIMARLLDAYELANGKKTERPKITYRGLVSVVCVGRNGRVQPLFK
jgi:hypothetical protein